MNFDYLEYPYSSKRTCLFAKNGVVATSEPLAAQAGLDILKKGGNAIDAAIATAAALTVVEPTSNGIGSDNFAIIWYNGKLYGMNSSGYSPKKLSIKELHKRGINEIKPHSWEAVTVPGTPAGWNLIWKNFGKLEFNILFEPAIKYANEGYPVSPTVSFYWNRANKIYKQKLKGEIFKYWFETFGYDAPKPGQIVKLPFHAKTFELIANSNSKEFYYGSLTDKIVKFSKKYNGYFDYEDFEDFKNNLVEPIKTNYNGYDIWELPPNVQGIITLMALNIFKNLNYSNEYEFYHNSIEALKLAFIDGKEYITDISKMNIKIEEMLSEKYAKQRSNLISSIAIDPKPGEIPMSNTVYLATADKWGNMVSFIQSNYMGFGSGIVVPETGIALQNRGHSFSLDEKHINFLEPRKKPYHTIIPGFITKGAMPIGPFGVMGGFMQPQGHLQVVLNMIDKNLNPQAALDAPRWQWIEGKKILVEKDFPSHIAEKLERHGHNINVLLNPGPFGRGQIIIKEKDVYVAGTEKRADGYIAVY
ncbi:gamma-glutamyltransferase 2. Threonine peptidase. MEROPS family T03 [Marinitoga hydrogenitolerans DSM 16785]|uniref:Gamma-glutamyltransferase 2. Threonine peptidase. MEROPS family T03 n=1 Tax=Marinitoga hydrogenitolerans (strain DSM 16785 / JCM 12826 / AT1271) TaxID=1122195 RepID=A0A1M4W3Y4_MARH1|nr:gamma-glutamyltransferase family protein [Marinitoga hydrogenitolerans]SHE75860.1 gamma-glutamyltransferase 2. Threonine peptidase. MEROPS family T03 [Marinitoga hydrogenitolerans DSM 16785]